MRALLAGLIALAGCGSSTDDTRGAGSGSGSAAGSGSAIAQQASGSGSASGSAAAVDSASPPDQLALKTGEKRHNPPAETAWKIPGTTMTATVIDAPPIKAGGAPTVRVVVWGHGKRHDIIRTTRSCDVVAELRHVTDSRLVFQCASSPVGDSPEGVFEDWLLRWSEEKDQPLRNRHWIGDPADTEPRWAQPPKAPKAEKPAKPKVARRHRKKVTRCCCEATLDDVTTHGWEPVDRCVSDADNEITASCVADKKCKVEIEVERAE